VISVTRYNKIHRVLSLLLSLLGLTAFGLVAHDWYLSHSLTRTVARISAEAPLEYGDRVDPNALQRALDQAGYSGQLKSRGYLLLYFVPNFAHLKSIKYGEALLERHGGAGLQVFAVTNAEPSEILVTAKSESLSLPILFDKNARLKLLLRVPRKYEYSYLLTTTGEVMFSVDGIPQEDVIRQIVEKYVTGTIDYSDPEERLYKVGELLPRIRVIHVTGGPVQTLVVRDAEIVLISARCTACQLQKDIQRYRELATSSGAARGRFLVFGQRFPQQELVRDLTAARVPLDNVYIAREPLGGLANEYRTKTAEEDSVVIGVERDGRIKTVKSLSQSE
jgi:hypothetical protein